MRIVVTCVLAVLLLAGPALAQPGNTPVGPPQAYQPPAAPAATYTKRYGGSIALADAASTAAVFIGALVFIGAAITEYDSGGGDGEGTMTVGAILMIGGSAGYVFGGPLIHHSHGNSSGSGKSLALRLGLPLAGGLLGSALDSGNCSDGDYCDDNYGPSLVALGLVSAMVIDWAVLAKKEVRVAAPVAPYAAPLRGGGMTFGVGGAF